MLIGRAAEQKVIDQLVAGSRIGRSGVLAITGEPGVGKTALLGYARTRLEDFRVMHATGTVPEQEIPFAGLHSLLRPALDQLDRIPGPQAEALSAALALREGSAGDRFAIGAATLSLVCRYAEESPVAIIVDDLQWLDRSSTEALAFAARRLSADPIAVLLTARAGEADDLIDGLPQVQLMGLELEAARDLVGFPTGTAMTGEQLARLHEVTGGNPLAMLELGRHPELLEHTGPDVPPPVSGALLAAYARRIRLLDPAGRSALLVAVVSNGDLHATSASCATLGLDAASLAPAEQMGLIAVTGDQIAFRHPLLRASAYADATASERQAAHRAVAAALPDHDTDRRAWHLSESTWTPDATVAAMLTATAERAAARTAYAIASTAYERAARLTPEPERGAVQLAKAAETAWTAGLVPRAVGLLDEIREWPATAEMKTALLQLRAAIAASTGSLTDARDMLEQAATQTPSADIRVTLLADAVRATFYLGDSQTARRLADKISKALDGSMSTEARAIGTVAMGIAKVLIGQGGADELRSAVPLLSGSAELLTDAKRLPWLMLAQLFLRDSGTGSELRLAVEQARSRAGVGALPSLLFHVARDEATTDSWTRAEANYVEAIRLARETGQSTELAVSLAGLAWLESRQGREDDCRAHVAEAMPICAERHIQLGEAWGLYALGDLELCLGNPQAATDHLRRLEDLLADLGLGDPDLSPRPELADALLRLGREAEAHNAAADYLAAANAKGQPWARARGQRARGLVAPADEFDDVFATALTLHEQTLDSFETGRTLFAYGSRLRRAGRRVDARPMLRDAIDAFTELGAARWADHAAAELRATGEKVPHREPHGAATLTPQELQVSLLLVEGHTTREAAAALFLSPKTVEYHLRKVYTKMGIRSRAELAERLPR